MNLLETLANFASILTAALAGIVTIYIWLDRRRKRAKLEAYLREVKTSAKGGEVGQKTVLHLMARLGMTEAEILQASFGSKRVKRTLAKDDKTGRAAAMLLEYNPTGQAS